MSRDLPSLNALRAFEAAARLHSISLAAEELHVTHGAVSRQVRLLEDDLGVALFGKDGRGVKLTDSGVRLRDASTLRDAPAKIPDIYVGPYHYMDDVRARNVMFGI
ncbi:LysR family transcriptional regulator, partial [Pseudomonas aeruginosa]